MRSADTVSAAPAQIESTAAATWVLNIFAALGHGGFLLDKERKVLAYNEPAANCLGDGLMLRGRRLAATDRGSDIRLQTSIGIVLLAARSAEEHRTVGVQRNLRQPLVVHVHRLAPDAPLRLLLIACDPELRQVPPAGMLSEMFELTPAEASVAVAIASCQQLAEIAADRRVKIDTIRVHIKSVFSKTRTRSQAELAVLVTRLALLTPGRKAPSSTLPAAGVNPFAQRRSIQQCKS
jgi:DNA-binding CsgD family transcriptional regulator